MTSAVLTPPPPAPPPSAGQCRASGAKHLSPPLDDTAACTRFMAAIASVPGVTGVELQILPQGVIRAVVTRAGAKGSPSDFSEAVMDRPLTVDDLDRLARNAVKELSAKSAP